VSVTNTMSKTTRKVVSWWNTSSNRAHRRAGLLHQDKAAFQSLHFKGEVHVAATFRLSPPLARLCTAIEFLKLTSPALLFDDRIEPHHGGSGPTYRRHPPSASPLAGPLSAPPRRWPLIRPGVLLGGRHRPSSRCESGVVGQFDCGRVPGWKMGRAVRIFVGCWKHANCGFGADGKSSRLRVPSGWTRIGANAAPTATARLERTPPERTVSELLPV
jgi:hypothetical protein